VDFDWLDKRSMDPVGYKRINKRTGKEIDKDNIVKGVEYEDGQYVIISPEEIADAYPRTTQTIEIQQFVDAADVSFVYLERPYYVAPINKGQKVYALLRDTLAKTGKIGIAKVVIQTKQHLAALIPSGDALVLNLMRWGDDVKPQDELDLPKSRRPRHDAERQRIEDGQDAGRRHVRQVGPRAIQGRIQGGGHGAGGQEGQGRQDRDRP